MNIDYQSLIPDTALSSSWTFKVSNNYLRGRRLRVRIRHFRNQFITEIVLDAIIERCMCLLYNTLQYSLLSAWRLWEFFMKDLRNLT